MPYIGHSPTQAGSYIEVDDFGSSFNGSNVAFTLQVGGVNITPNQQNLLVMIDGVLQQPSNAFSVSGSTITFTEAPVNGADLYCLLMGQSASVGQGTIGADELKVSGDGSDGQVLKSDGDGTFTWLSQDDIAAGTLANARTINGVSFNGSANITVTADANTLSNTTLKSTVVNSSLTSVGTLTGLTTRGLEVKDSGGNGFVYTINGSSPYEHIIAVGGGESMSIGAGGTSNKSLKIDSSQNATFAGTITVGASNGSEEVKANRTRVRHIDGLADASDYSHGDLFINHISSGNIICSSNVAIGHTNPAYKLDLSSSESIVSQFTGSSGETILSLDNTSTNGDKWYLISGGSGGSFAGGKFGIFNADTTTAVATFTNDGKAGIATNNPQTTLHVGTGNEAPDIDAVALISNAGTTNLAIRNSSNNVELLNYVDSSQGIIGTVTSHPLRIRTANSDRISITSGGFVGIGASPNALLDLNKSTSSTDLPTANESFEGYRLILANPQLTNNATNALGFSMYNGEVCAYIATQTYYNGQYETDIIFGTRDDNRDDGIDDTVGDGLKEAFRIDHDSNIQFHGNMFGGGSKDTAPWNDSSGNGVLYYQKGTSALGATLALSTNVDVGGGYAGIYINLIGASASGDRMIAFGMDGNSAGQIHYSGSNQVAYATSGSDKRLKKNITNWTGDTLSKFANIEPKMFHWKTQDSSEDKIKGFIAQDMIENFPEAYPLGKMGEGDDQIERYQYNPSGMVIYLMKALKEQVAVNADLTSRIKALENA